MGFFFFLNCNVNTTAHYRWTESTIDKLNNQDISRDLLFRRPHCSVVAVVVGASLSIYSNLACSQLFKCFCAPV